MPFIVWLLPLERQRREIKSLKLLISANLSHNGGFAGLKVTPKGPALWQGSLPVHGTSRG